MRVCLTIFAQESSALLFLAIAWVSGPPSSPDASSPSSLSLADQYAQDKRAPELKARNESSCRPEIWVEAPPPAACPERGVSNSPFTGFPETWTFTHVPNQLMG